MHAWSAVILECNSVLQKLVIDLLVPRGWDLHFCATLQSLLLLVQKMSADLAIIDEQALDYPSLVRTLEQLQMRVPSIRVILVQGPLGSPSFEAAGHPGTVTVSKPLGSDDLLHTINMMFAPVIPTPAPVAKIGDDKLAMRRSKPALPEHASQPVVGESAAFLAVMEAVEEVASSDMTVLIRGESGTGKEVVAQMIHSRSSRAARGPFIKTHCPALPEALLESELFGHQQGAFTGAVSHKPGRFEQAEGGTIFLDEIGEIPPGVQAKLLQVIEQKEFHRLGGLKVLSVNARVLAATNAPLEEMMTQRSFRSDLYYRLNEYCIVLPPLRERPEDIPLLVRTFVSQFERETSQTAQKISSPVMRAMLQYQWPGNVRELKSLMHRYVLSGDENVILKSVGSSRRSLATCSNGNRLHESEMNIIATALLQAHWNRRLVARQLGISYSSLRRKIEKYQLNQKSATDLMEALAREDRARPLHACD